MATGLTDELLAFNLMRWLGAAFFDSARRRQAPMVVPAREQPKSAGLAGRSSALSAVREELINNLTKSQAASVHDRLHYKVRITRCRSVTTQLLVLGPTQKTTGLVVQGSIALASGTVGGWFARNPGFLVRCKEPSPAASWLD